MSSDAHPSPVPFATPSELVERHTDLGPDELEHLQRLMGCWAALSDLSFSDLLLVAPVRGSGGAQLVVLGQVRPTTSATISSGDLVGQIVAASELPLAHDAYQLGQTRSGVAPVPVPVRRGAMLLALSPRESGEVPVVPGEARYECVPVRFGPGPIAVMVRLSAFEVRRPTGRLERIYRGLFDRLCAMVAAGDYPFVGEDLIGEDAPRVGDGLVLVDTEGHVVYASPNAMNALHRMGVSSAVIGRSLEDLGVEDGAVKRALQSGRPVIEEVERRPDVIVLLHCTPLIAGGAVTGAMVLLRDVTDLRRLDRLLLSKDAAIREVHHRVKNNLQTISSLLRLQARRLQPGEGREALREAERRVASIALVHEVLSREPGDEVPFGEIVTALVEMAEESDAAGRRVVIEVGGDLGDVIAAVATPLALVLAELLQNAVEHAFSDAAASDHPAGAGDLDAPVGRVAITLVNEGGRLHIEVRDDGRGLPAGFDIERTTSLGLSIVRDLVTSQLGGSILMGSEEGTTVTIDVPVPS